MRFPTHLLNALALAVLSIAPAFARPAACQAEAVNAVAQLLQERYARADVAHRYAQALRQHLAQGRYCSAQDGDALAGQLTTDLQAVHPDRHLKVRHSTTPLPADEPTWSPSAEEAEQARRAQLRDNVGFEKVEVIKGNVGYLRFSYFGDPTLGAPKLEAAMAFLADTDALVIDLRRNMGATDPELIDLLSRYLVRDADLVTPVVHWRDTRPDPMKSPKPWPLQGRRYLDKPVYMLSSGSTFSGAEGFLYNLQAMRRATVVGERTGGGANPGRELRATDHLAVWVPLGYTEHPLTRTSWEGVGVIPDRELPARQALPAALQLAYEQLLRTALQDPNHARLLQAQRNAASAELDKPDTRPTLDFALRGFSKAKQVAVVGSFNDWSPQANPMRRVGSRWEARVRAEPGEHTYKFWVDGQWLLDPANPAVLKDEQGNPNSLRRAKAR